MYDFKQVDAAVLAATSTEWSAQLNQFEDRLPRSQHEGALAWAKGLVEIPDGTKYAYSLLRDGQAHACALLDISYAKTWGDSWLKVLQVYTEPAVDVSIAEGDGALAELAEIAAEALVRTFRLTYQEHPCNRLKVYGRTPLTVDFLKGVAGHLANMPDLGVQIKAQGGWLLFEK